MALSHHQQGPELSHCSVYEAGCLSSTNLVWKAWRILRELLAFRVQRNPKLGAIISEEYSSGSNLINELCNRAKVKKAESHAPFLAVTGCYPHLRWIFPLRMICSRIPSLRTIAACHSVDSVAALLLTCSRFRRAFLHNGRRGSS